MSGNSNVTKCYYCAKPMTAVAHFASGVSVTVCNEHHERHLAGAEADARVEQATRARDSALRVLSEAERVAGCAEQRWLQAEDELQQAIEDRKKPR